MTDYAKVQVGVVVSVGSLPKSYMNVSGFNTLDNVTLKEYGFYPVNIVLPEYDSLTEKLGAIEYIINADDVTMTYDVVALDEAELEAEKAGLVTAATGKLNTVLYETDWVHLSDAGLTEPQLAAYVALRTDALAVRTDLADYTVEELAGLLSVLQDCADCTCSRFPDFSAAMTALKDYLETLLAE